MNSRDLGSLQRGRRGATAVSWGLYVLCAAGIVSALIGASSSFQDSDCATRSALPLFVAVYAFAALLSSIWGVSDGHKSANGAWLISQTTLSKGVVLILFAGVALGGGLFAEVGCSTVSTVHTTSAIVIGVSAASLLLLFILLNGDFVRGLPILGQNANVLARLERVAPRRGIPSYSFGLWMTLAILILGIGALIMGLIALSSPPSTAVACAALFVTMAAIWQIVVTIYAAATAVRALGAWLASRATTPLAITTAIVTSVGFAFAIYGAGLSATTGPDKGLLIGSAIVLGLSLIGLIWMAVRLIRNVFTLDRLKGLTPPRNHA